jgi:hypothetical protein
MANSLRWQLPFDWKGNGTLKVKALRWQRSFNDKGTSMTKAAQWQKPFDGKSPSVAKARALWRQRPFDGKGKVTLKLKAFRWQRPFNANTLRRQRQRPFEGNVRPFESWYHHSSLGTEYVALPENLDRIEDVAVVN